MENLQNPYPLAEAVTITLEPTVKQHWAWEALNDMTTKYPVFGGGAGGGKSWLGCEWLLVNCYRWPGSKWFIGRDELKRLMQSTYVTWTKVCKHHNIPSSDWKLNGQYNYIEFSNGSRIDLLDLKYIPSDPLYERFGSIEFTGGWIEEGGEVHFLAFDVLKTRVGRHMNKEYGIPSKILITCNPKKNWLYQEVYKPWKEGHLPSEYKFIQSLYGDNPHTATEYGSNLSNLKDQSLKQRLMFGNWEYDDDPNAIIQYDAIIDMFTNTVDVNGKFLTGDIARFGKDKTVLYLWQGLEVYKQIVFVKYGIDQIVTELRTLLANEQIPFSHCVVDEGGVGGGVVDFMRGIKGFISNATPMKSPVTYQKQNFGSLRDQCYFMLADNINDHKIAFKNFEHQTRILLIEELEQIKAQDVDTAEQKYRIIKKDDMKEALGRSPDFADALMMRMYFELSPIIRGGGPRTHVPRGLDRTPGITYRIPQQNP